MTNPIRKNDKTSRVPLAGGFALRTIAGAGLLVGLVGVGSLTGCAEEEPPPPPAPVVQAPPPKPDPMANITLDPRVQWPEEMHPSSPELAEAIAKLVNGLAAADADAFTSVLSDVDRQLTQELVTFGLWQKQMERVEAVRVCVLNELTATECELGVGLQTANGAYMIAFNGRTSSPWRFTGLGITDIEAPRVAMLDNSPLMRPMIPEAAEIIAIVPIAEDGVGGGGGGGGYDDAPPSTPPGSPPRKPRRHYR